MTDVTAHDYRWFGEEFASLAEAYCLTLVRARTPEDVLGTLGAELTGPVRGVRALEELSYEAWEAHDGHRFHVGVTALDGWSLMVEPNGYLGTLPAVLAPLSAGRTVVSHFRNVNAVDHFTWYEDGELRLHFEPLFADQRDGSDPDGLVDVMRDVGFDLAEDGGYELHTEAAFALAERLTGVPVTAGLLRSADFTGGLAPIAGG